MHYLFFRFRGLRRELFYILMITHALGTRQVPVCVRGGRGEGEGVGVWTCGWWRVVEGVGVSGWAGAAAVWFAWHAILVDGRFTFRLSVQIEPSVRPGM